MISKVVKARIALVVIVALFTAPFIASWYLVFYTDFKKNDIVVQNGSLTHPVIEVGAIEAIAIGDETKQKLLEQLFSPNFLVFLVTVLVIASGFIFMSRENAAIDNIIKYWQMILPVVTTYIGYAIGKGKSKDS